MLRKICISQPMLFPWVGMLEQIRLADVYVHYDDVQFSKGSFTNRVQVKTANGPAWMTVPLKNTKLGQAINEVEINEDLNWRHKHLAMIEQAYAKAPYVNDVLSLVKGVYDGHRDNLCGLVMESMHAVLRYFELDAGKVIAVSSKLGLPGKSSERVLACVKGFEANFYITGHGAANYLDHEGFEKSGVQVGYMNYLKKPYPQLHGEFTPYVTSLDLIANCGKDGRSVICSDTLDWKEFVK